MECFTGLIAKLNLTFFFFWFPELSSFGHVGLVVGGFSFKLAVGGAAKLFRKEISNLRLELEQRMRARLFAPLAVAGAPNQHMIKII